MLFLNALLGALMAGSTPLLWTPDTLSTAAYESSPIFSPDGREMYFFRADPGFSRYSLAWAKCTNGAWQEQEPLPFSLPAPISESDPFMSADGRRLYFISTRTENGGNKEDFDIWYADRDETGVWSTAARLPEPVNSNASELLPRASADGGLLFGSDREGGYGGQDIYTAHEKADGRWAVENLGPPMSSRANDYEADMSPDGTRIVVVSDRSGRSHLHLFGLQDNVWTADGMVPARDEVFQVGPLFSPLGEKLLFAQALPERSGEFFVWSLKPGSAEIWPPHCP